MNWIGVSLSIGVLVVGLLLIELGARALMPQWVPAGDGRRFWVYDENLGWANVPGSQGTMLHQDFSITVAHNSVGLRDREYSMDRTPDTRRMLVIGSSFSWGYGVERDEIYVEVLEARHPRWEIINASVSGYSTDQELLYLREWGPRFRPDIVLLPLHYTDVSGNIVSSRYWHNKPVFDRASGGQHRLRDQSVPPADLKQRIQRYLLGRTYFFSKLSVRLLSISRSGRLPVVRQRSARGFLRSTVGFDITRGLVGEIDDIAKQLGAQLVVVLFPTSRSDWLRFIRRSLDIRAIPHVGLREAFVDKAGPLKFEHDRHWNAAGHRVAADVIEAFLIEQKILP